MLKYTIKRILLTPILFFLAAMLIFTFLNMSPADPVLMMMPAEYTQADYDAMAARFGLDQPKPVQFLNWAKNALKGDLGISYATKMPVMNDIVYRIPTSLRLALLATCIIVLFGLPLGVGCAVKQYTAFDNIVNVLAKVMGSVPGFWLGLMLIIGFSVKLKLLPTFGTGTWKHYVLPVATLSLPFLANYIRQVRSAMLDCIRQDYVRTARSKGASERTVIFRDALKNAMMPIVTTTGGTFCGLVAGAVVVERVFAIPGIGSAIVTAINNRDMPALLACSMVMSVVIILMGLFIDLAYAFVDPRVRSTFEGQKKAKKVKKTEGVSGNG